MHHTYLEGEHIQQTVYLFIYLFEQVQQTHAPFEHSSYEDFTHRDVLRSPFYRLSKAADFQFGNNHNSEPPQISCQLEW